MLPLSSVFLGCRKACCQLLSLLFEGHTALSDLSRGPQKSPSVLPTAMSILVLNIQITLRILPQHFSSSSPRSKTGSEKIMAPLIHLVSTAYGYTTSSYRYPHPELLNKAQKLISFFLHPQLDVNFFFEPSNGFALSPYSLLEFIAVFFAVCMTLVTAVVLIGGFGQAKRDDSVAGRPQLPEMINVCKEKVDVQPIADRFLRASVCEN